MLVCDPGNEESSSLVRNLLALVGRSLKVMEVSGTAAPVASVTATYQIDFGPAEQGAANAKPTDNRLQINGFPLFA